MEISKKWSLQAEVRRNSFHTKIFTEFYTMPMLARFPYPVQKLILKEYREVERDGGVTLCELGNDITCHCLFYYQWQLPYRHIIL
jgi:hypothetical protein